MRTERCPSTSLFSRLRPAVLLIPVFTSFLIQPAQARDPLYGALDNEALVECENLHWSGNAAQASACYTDLYSSQQPSSIRAEAL